MEVGNVLIVGGAGYVGGTITDLVSGSNVCVYDSLCFENEYLKPGVEFVHGDVRDERLLSKWLDWADAVIWLAAHVGDGACTVDPEASLHVNRDCVRFLSEQFRGRMIFLSTCSVYGAQDGILTEDSAVKPLSLYATSKLEAEQFLLDKNAIIFRLGTLFGKGDNYSRIRLDLVLNALICDAFKKGRMKVFGGEQFRPLLHVRDAGQAIVNALDAVETGIFNLHSHNVRIEELAWQVQNCFPGALIETTDLPFEDLRNYRVNSDKARRELGFMPRRSVNEGIEELRAIFQAGRIKNLAQSRYHNHRFFKENRPFSEFHAEPQPVAEPTLELVAMR
jgi:nucleoside-diphosphate-sugar epimerase